MNWLGLAILGHLANAVAFIIDKALLSSSFKRSATYAAMIGGLSLAVLIAAPWVTAWPEQGTWPAVVAFGGLFVFALWAFFEALKRTEASRVVPIVGSLIPIFTLIGTATFFGERLTNLQSGGFVLLIIATWLLTRGGTKRMIDGQTLLICLLSAILFAASTVFGKYVFEHGDFLGGFVASRVVAGVTGLLIGWFAPGVRNEIRAMLRPKKKGNRTVRAPSPIVPVIGQLFGSAGFVLVHLSIKFGSAAIVNALQAVQYAAIVLVAWFGGKTLRKMLAEERTPRVIALKSFALLLVAVGLGLLT